MPLPTGQISLNDIFQPIANAGDLPPNPVSNPINLQFLNNYLKNPPSTPNIDAFRGLEYYQRNADGNCNNSNCTEALSSGDLQCQNCSLVAVNCANCDTQRRYQANCNCACTYNCTQNNNQRYNCNCNCACNCFWSDPALKTDIESIADPLGVIRSLSGFFYRGNEQAQRLGLDTSRTVGVSAEEVERNLPEALGPLMNNYRTVQYERLIPVLIEAVKALEHKIDQQNSNK